MGSRTHALLINGGGSAKKNYQSHVLHVHELVDLLVARGLPEQHISVFASDGTDPAPDLAVRERELDEHYWLIKRLPVSAKLGEPMRYVNSTFGSHAVYPAQKAALETWFENAAGSLAPGDTLLIYVTDHGNRNNKDPTDNSIVLWGEELSVRELGELLRRLPPGVRVVTLMSQCYSGSFANVIYDAEGAHEPDGSVCGYFASTADQPAYGCYPENQGRENVGYSFRFIEAMRSTPRFPEAHARVLTTDQTPDVPNRTSDYYLQTLLGDAAKARGIPERELVNDLLELAWEQADSWEEVELLEQVSGTLGSLNARSIPDLDRETARLGKLAKRLATHANRWRAGLLDLKRENFRRFLEQHPDWRALVKPDVLDSLDPEDRRGMRRDLLEALVTFTATDRSMQSRLDTMRVRFTLADKARYRMQVRLATVARLRLLLTRIAGRVLLETSTDPDQRSAFERLNSCESLALDPPAKPLRSRLVEPEPFPPVEDDIRLAEDLVPGWMGISFKRTPAPGKTPSPASPGTVGVEKVYPGSPAERAGIEAGDVILGPPGDHFTWANEIRQWTMLTPLHEPRELELLRNGETVTISIEFDPYPSGLPK
jgi:hypothetical protein